MNGYWIVDGCGIGLGFGGLFDTAEKAMQYIDQYAGGEEGLLEWREEKLPHIYHSKDSWGVTYNVRFVFFHELWLKGGKE